MSLIESIAYLLSIYVIVSLSITGLWWGLNYAGVLSVFPALHVCFIVSFCLISFLWSMTSLVNDFFT